MARAVAEPGDLVGVGVAEDLSVGRGCRGVPSAAESVGAEEARGVEAEEVGEGGDGVGKEAVEEEQSQENPLQERVYENNGDFGSVAVVEHCGEFVGRSSTHCCCCLLLLRRQWRRRSEGIVVLTMWRKPREVLMERKRKKFKCSTIFYFIFIFSLCKLERERA